MELAPSVQVGGGPSLPLDPVDGLSFSLPVQGNVFLRVAWDEFCVDSIVAVVSCRPLEDGDPVDELVVESVVLDTLLGREPSPAEVVARGTVAFRCQVRRSVKHLGPFTLAEVQVVSDAVRNEVNSTLVRACSRIVQTPVGVGADCSLSLAVLVPAELRQSVLLGRSAPFRVDFIPCVPGGLRSVPLGASLVD
jgi:hypothetical protein